MNSPQRSPVPTTQYGAVLTDLAQRYTHPTGKDHKILSKTGKSGLTPLFTPRGPLSPKWQKKKEQYEFYQRAMFYSLTTRDFMRADSFAPGYFYFGAPTTNPINCLFDRSKWQRQHRASVPLQLLPGPVHGYWDVSDNDRLWEVLQPSLRMASQFLEQHSVLAWWSTLLDGQYSSIETGIPDKWKGDQLCRVRKRSFFQGFPAGLRPDFRADLDNIFDGIFFMLDGSETNIWTGRPVKEGAFGITGYLPFEQNVRNRIVVTLALEVVEPLLQNNLSGAERMLDEVRVATILLHELSHAVWKVILPDHGKEDGDEEPYFENHVLSELGFAFEESVLGGRQDYLTSIAVPPYDYSGNLSAAACLHASWLCVASKTLAGEVILEPKPANWKQADFWATPLQHFESLNHEDFWNIHAKRYPDAIKYPKIFGVRVNLNESRNYQQIVDLLNKPDPDLIDIEPGMSPADLSAANFENDRRIAARKIRNAARETKAATERRKAREIVEQEMMNQSIQVALNIQEAAVAAGQPAPAPNINWPSSLYMTDYSNSTESSDAVSCPRYEEIRRYILANRSQGKLCLDTMFEMPENTLLNHIRLLGELFLTTEEWRNFLRTASDRGELFRWDSKGRGMVQWIEPLPPGPLFNPRVPSQDVRDLTPDQVAFFARLATTWKWHDYEYMFDDIEFNDLSTMFTRIVGSEKRTINAAVLKVFVDYNDWKMELYCWGPNGVVRKLTPNWPQPQPPVP